MRDKRDIVFVNQPPYLDLVSRILKRRGNNVYYLGLLDFRGSTEAEKQRALMLKAHGILPLPLEEQAELSGILRDWKDPEKKLQRRIEQFVPDRLLQAFERLYPNNANIKAKLFAVIQSLFGVRADAEIKINQWGRAHPERSLVVIYSDVTGFLTANLAPNVRCFVVPLNMFVRGVSVIGRAVLDVARQKRVAQDGSGLPQGNIPRGIRNESADRVVFVTHRGLTYGSLHHKSLYYSHRKDSELHQGNLLHFDYSGVPRPSENIKWVCLGRPRLSWLSLRCALLAVINGILHVRNARNVIGLLLLAWVYTAFRFYLRRLGDYPHLKVGLIDYDVLCPKPLLLAFEARGIKTVATQERFLLAFYGVTGTILDIYLCGSEYVAGVMKESSAYCVNCYQPVGLYRSDNLIQARQLPPPGILAAPLASGRRVITALGFHTSLQWHTSQSDMLLNWSAHRQFMEDMIRLSRDVPDVHIVLRYKTVDWVALPIFADLVRQIESSGNMAISMDYEKSFFSYDLCAHSHLVIAKHTSLGDECLSVGIPVLFHEYTHNAKRMLADIFSYSPSRIMCFNYRQLLERTLVVLAGEPNELTSDYDCLRKNVYGGLGDGNVRERIHACIEALLE